MDQDPLDLNKILLPKKEEPSVDSAQRVDAGTLLNQEQNASLIKPAAPAPAPTTAVTPPTPLGESVPPLQTFQSDIASTIQDKNASVVSIAAAEANRRGQQPVSQDAQLQTSNSHPVRNVFFGILGVLLMAGAGAVIFYALILKAPFPSQQADIAPFIAIDGTSKVTVASTTQGRALMQQLTEAKTSVSLSFGLVSQILIEKEPSSSGETPAYLNTQELFSLIAPGMPPTLLRDVAPVYLLGIHSFGINQPFLILKADSYELAYAGMLSWEKTMKQELSPLFSNVPVPDVVKPAQNPPIGSPEPQTDSASASSTMSASSTPVVATSTILATSSPEVPLPPPSNGFIDAIVENHDARVTKDRYGSIDFLWTFLDRQTLVITTSPGTLHEVIARLKQAPLISHPIIR